jgi:hypothetical protein
MRRITFALVILSFATACDSTNEVKDLRGKEVQSTIVSNEMSQNELDASLEKIRKEEEEKERVKNESRTSLEFDKLVHNFGDVKAEVENKTSFIVKNTGNKPLIIENVEASCGCTTPKKPEKPILPGKSDEIHVTFKSNPGQIGDQTKSITVTANTVERIHHLEIKAHVVK